MKGLDALHSLSNSKDATYEGVGGKGIARIIAVNIFTRIIKVLEMRKALLFASDNLSVFVDFFFVEEAFLKMSFFFPFHFDESTFAP